jgi:outer membrane protein TolC
MKSQHPYIITVLTVIALLATSLRGVAQRTLSLNDAINLAKIHNRELRLDSLNIGKSIQETALTKSYLLPNVSLTGQFQHYFQKPVFFGLNGNSASSEKIGYARFGGEDQAGAQVSLVQPLWNASAKQALQLKRTMETQSRLSFQDRETDVVAKVRQNYVQLLVLRERLSLQNESITRNKRALVDARSLLAQGRGLRVDTLRAYTTVRNLEPDLLRLNYAIQISLSQLNLLLGSDTTTDYVLSDSLQFQPSDSIPTEAGVYLASLQRRPDLKKLSLDKETTDQQIRLAKAGRLPVVNFVSQYQLNTQTNGFRFGNAYYPPVFFAGLQLSIPLFSGMQHVAKVNLARIEWQQANIAYTQAQEQLRTEVKQVLAALYEASERIKTQQNVSETAGLSYSITKYRYEKGVASRLELIDAEFSLTTARSNYLEAVYDYLSAKIELDRTMGRTGADF